MKGYGDSSNEWCVTRSSEILCPLYSSRLFSEWNEEGVSRAEILRLIYQGRFLHGNVTLGALGLPPGRTSVMHLVPRETLPEPNSQGSIFTSQFSLFEATSVVTHYLSTAIKWAITCHFDWYISTPNSRSICTELEHLYPLILLKTSVSCWKFVSGGSRDSGYSCLSTHWDTFSLTVCSCFLFTFHRSTTEKQEWTQ